MTSMLIHCRLLTETTRVVQNMTSRVWCVTKTPESSSPLLAAWCWRLTDYSPLLPAPVSSLQSSGRLQSSLLSGSRWLKVKHTADRVVEVQHSAPLIDPSVRLHLGHLADVFTKWDLQWSVRTLTHRRRVNLVRRQPAGQQTSALNNVH